MRTKRSEHLVQHLPATDWFNASVAEAATARDGCWKNRHHFDSDSSVCRYDRAEREFLPTSDCLIENAFYEAKKLPVYSFC